MFYVGFTKKRNDQMLDWMDEVKRFSGATWMRIAFVDKQREYLHPAADRNC